MKLYRIAKSNRIVPDYKLEIVDEIFGVGMVENLIKNHTITEIEKLNVIDCLKYGNKVVAIRFIIALLWSKQKIWLMLLKKI